VSENGTPRERVVVARYAAPGPLRPGHVQGLSVRRRGRRFRVSFSHATHANGYLVRITASDGRRLLKLLGARGHTFALPVLGYNDSVTVTVAGQTRLGRSGPVARARTR
jgi:hypothetical protein